MRYFSYFGKSCLDVLGPDGQLILVSMDGEVDDVPGSTKEVIKGDTSIYKTVANEYGNMYDDVLEFEYSLIKFNDELITKDEQRRIERWLTSPKLSQYLQLFDVTCEDGALVPASTPKAIYCGTFVETNWIPCGDGFIGVTFKFQCDSPYAWNFIDESLYINEEHREQIIYAVTDDTQHYVYPTLTIKALNDSDEQIMHDVEFEFINNTDSGNSFKMKTQIGKTVVMDCRACRVTDNAGNLFTYEDLGWNDVGNIYWLRLSYGSNVFTLKTDDPITIEMGISYMYPEKIVGGWL